MTRTHPARRAWLGWALLPLAIVGFAAVWLLYAMATGEQASWLAVVGAADVLWVLGLTSRHRPAVRSTLAVLATLVIVVLANWSIAAAHVGREFGLLPWDSLTRLGFDHGRTLLGLANGWQDGLWIAAAVVLAAAWPWFSGRRRAPSAR